MLAAHLYLRPCMPKWYNTDNFSLISWLKFLITLLRVRKKSYMTGKNDGPDKKYVLAYSSDQMESQADKRGIAYNAVWSFRDG